MSPTFVSAPWGLEILNYKGESEAKKCKTWKGRKNKQNKARINCFVNLKHPFTDITESTACADTLIQ